MPLPGITKLLVRDFNSFDLFKTQFADTAKNRFGSGWAYFMENC
ncbi:Fe-Mn family superoxide dismutase [Terrimonas sp.]